MPNITDVDGVSHKTIKNTKNTFYFVIPSNKETVNLTKIVGGVAPIIYSAAILALRYGPVFTLAVVAWGVRKAIVHYSDKYSNE